MHSWTFTPIGIVSSPRVHRYDAPRQGVLDAGVEAELRLEAGRNFEQAARELAGFERIWLLYVFHRNEGWRPRVQVPRHSERRIGVFATRAPYRPNPIGLSCVRLLGVDGLVLRLAECDLLDGTPVLDIKPYLPYADSFPDAATGWVPAAEVLYDVSCTPDAQRRLDWLRDRGLDLLPFARTQLEAAPRDGRRKRVTRVADAAIADATADSETYVLAYRTWRLSFRVFEQEREVRIFTITSGYTPREREEAEDPHEDKALHRAFVTAFPA